MYKVINRFRDKTNHQHYFDVGDNFTSKDKKRIKDLLERNLIEEIKKQEEKAEDKKE